MNSLVTVIGYLVLVGIGFGLWGYARLVPSHLAPLSQLLDRLIARRKTRIALLAIWWWAGWHFITNVQLISVIP